MESKLNHEIIIEVDDCDLEELGELGSVDEEELGKVIRETIVLVLEAEQVGLPCEVNVLLTDNLGIRETNRQMRDLNEITDVLSFPMFEFAPACPPSVEDKRLLDHSGFLPLGDMVLSLERIFAQGEEFGHGFWRECRYLVVHSVLHLLGYDHVDEGEMKKEMRGREKEIMAGIG